MLVLNSRRIVEDGGRDRRADHGAKPSAVAEKRYHVRLLGLRRKWCAKIEAWILEEANIPQPEKGESRLPGVR